MPTSAPRAFLVALLVTASACASAGVFAQETTTDEPDLDLREANVVGVTFEPVGDGRYDLSVTLFHDDDGEPGYANWWQVETLNGTELGRRELAHPHGTRPFTRSERIEVPAGVSLVVVRGHDRTHGYGGQATVVDLRTGATETLQQGPERRNGSDCEVLHSETGATTTTRTADGTLRTANVTTTTAPAMTTTNETDLVRCPWDASAEKTTVGDEATPVNLTG